MVTDDRSPLISGSGAPTDAKLAVIYDGTTAIGSATVNSDGTWSFVPTTPLSDQTAHDLTYTYADAAGNQSGHSPDLNFTENTQPPPSSDTIAIINYFDDVTPQTGTFGSGVPTNDTLPLLNGTVSGLNTSVGEVVNLFQDGTYLGSATVSSDGSTWSYQITTPLQDKTTYDFQAIITSASGVEGTKSNDFNLPVKLSYTGNGTVSIDNYTDIVEPQTGTFGSGTSTNDPNPVLNGTASGLNPGDVVNIYDVDGATPQLLGTASVNTDGTWHYQLSSLQNQTTYNYQAIITDGAGNQDPNKSNIFILTELTQNLNPPPAITQVMDNVGDGVIDYTGPIANSSTTSTNDPQPVISGTADQTNATLVYVFDNGSTTPLGSATVNSDGT
jgi:hypothetical protein